jgi:hypothetical protein
MVIKRLLLYIPPPALSRLVLVDSPPASPPVTVKPSSVLLIAPTTT